MLATTYASDHSSCCPCSYCADYEAQLAADAERAMDAITTDVPGLLRDLAADVIGDAIHGSEVDSDDHTLHAHLWRSVAAYAAEMLAKYEVK